MDSFSNIIVAFMKTIIDIEDMIGKMLGIAQVMVYLNLGLYDTASSIENSKEFQMVVGFLCFDPNTLVKKKNNEICKMSELSLGDVLDGNSEILIILKIKNKTKEKLYKLKGLNNTDIYVTGSHLIYKKDKGYILVKDHPDSIKTEDYCDEYCCFITSNTKIQIGKYVFHDWEDDYEREKLKYKKC
jgi:predicted RNA binding protein YcfA (HicA-like mRNA interferase family)